MQEQTLLPVQFTAHQTPSLLPSRGFALADGGTPSGKRGETRPKPLVEALEPRVCFAAVGAVVNGILTGVVPWVIPHRTGTPPTQDLNDQIGEAQSLGA